MPDKTEKVNEEDRLTQNTFLWRLRGKQVEVTFVDGEALEGELVDFDTYTLFVRGESGQEMAIFKHAIKYVCLAA